MESGFIRNSVVTSSREVLDNTCHFIQFILPEMPRQVPWSSEVVVGAIATFTTKGGDKVRPFPGRETSAVTRLGVPTAMQFRLRGSLLFEQV